MSSTVIPLSQRLTLARCNSHFTTISPCRSSHSRPLYTKLILCQTGFGEPRNDRRRKEVSFTRLRKGETLNLKEGWTQLANLADFEEQRQTLPVITNQGIALVLYRFQGDLFCSDANSTAYKFPLNDGRVFEGPCGPAVECPLDGTSYDLKTGQVLEWCPRTNPLRTLLGMLKAKENPVNLSVYDVVVAEDGTIFAKLF